MHAIQIRNVPDELYNRLKNVSHTNHRSISGEILSILEKHLLYVESSADDCFNEIGSVREQIARQYGISASSVERIREDRMQ